MDGSTVLDRLEQFGLSPKEAETYLVALEIGETKASVLAERADISKRHIYTICESLEARGLLEVHDHLTPTEVAPVAPASAIGRLTEQLQSIQPALESRFDRNRDSIREFEVVKSRPTVRKRLSELISGAREEVIAAVPDEILDGVAAKLATAVDRDVLVLLLVMGAEEYDQDRFEGVADVVRGWDQTAPTLLAVDDRVGLFAPSRMVRRAHTDDQAIVFAQDQLVPTLSSSLYGNYWPVAEEVHVADPADLPRTYANFRRAVLDATLYCRRNRDLAVTFDGRPVRSDGPAETYRGRVVETRQSLVRPTTNTFAIENSIVVDTESAGTVSVGGTAAFVEEFEATRVVLETAAEP